MRRVILETPFRGTAHSPLQAWWNRWRNRVYARRCLMDSLQRGEAPFASHLLYPQVLHDSWDEERAMGIAAGMAWHEAAEAVVAYVDCGVSAGMQDAITAAERRGIAVECRSLYDAPRTAR